ncbi:MAG: glycosyltransferase, partial [Cyanobium sp.]|nr:glycosyltransferase [Cyanobium sp.]
VPAWKSKYPLARVGPDFYYQRGNHLPGNFRSVAHVPMRAVLHHFKWRSRLYEAFARQRGTGTNFGEMAVYRQWLETHGRLPLEGAKPCSRAALEAEGWLRRPTQAEGRQLEALIQERSAGASSGLRVGFVTFELGGPGTPNGGIATAISALAKLQAAHGISVEVFYCPFHMLRELPALWFEYWATFGVTLHYIPRLAADEERTLETHEVEQAIVEAVRQAGPFDLLHFHDTYGFAAAFTMLKAAGLEFTETTLAITTHGGTRWHNEPNGTPWDEAAYEQELVGQRLCDVVVSPSAYLIDWNRVHGALPGRELVLPNVLEPESKSFTPAVEAAVLPGCVAFFGRVEIRKGFDLFLAALRELVTTTDLRPEVLILGRFGNGYSQERFEAETADLPLRITHHGSLNPQQALRMLKERRALAIMPSRQENSPYVVYEAMENQLPFLASFTGGTAELIRSEDRPEAELPADPIAMATRMARALREGVRPARLAIDPLEIELRNLTTWRSLAAERGRPADRPGQQATPPLARVPLSEWRLAARRDPHNIVALVPDGDAVSDETLQGMTRLLARAPFADVVEPFCHVVEEGTGRQMTSLQIRTKATPQEAALITGALPVVLRAGGLAELEPVLAPVREEQLFGTLMEGIQTAGKRVLPAPIDVGTRRFSPGLEARSLCNRLWLPIGRSSMLDRTTVAPIDMVQLCGVLSTDPYVAISTWSVSAPYGALSLFPQAFQGRPSLHLITLGSSLLWAVPDELPRRLAEAAERWPQARFRVLASDAVELQALREGGLPAVLGNLNMFVSEQDFHPPHDAVSTPSWDAICIGALELRENHFLARQIPSLALVHHRYAGMEDVGQEVRRLLPQAGYLTDDPESPEGFFYPSTDQLSSWIGQSATGVVLSETNGSCPESVQMLLCGTPVVSVPNLGGRDHFLHPPHALSVDATPEAVAAGVAELKARQLSRQEVYRATLRRLQEARVRFAADVDAAIAEEFGPGLSGVDVTPLIGEATRYRKAFDVLGEGLATAPEGQSRHESLIDCARLLETNNRSQPQFSQPEPKAAIPDKQSRYSPEAIRLKLQSAERMMSLGSSMEEVCAFLEVPSITFQRWRQHYGTLMKHDAIRIIELERENVQLKKLLADAELEKEKLRDLARSLSSVATSSSGFTTPLLFGSTVGLPVERRRRGLISPGG